MRVNIYTQELTDEVQLIHKNGNDGELFSAIMLMLHSSNHLHQPPEHVGGDDDRSAVTFWIPKSEARRESLAQTFEQMAKLVRLAPPENNKVFETFEEIWEKDGKWEGGREFLQSVVNDLKGKSLQFIQDTEHDDLVHVVLPLPRRTRTRTHNPFDCLFIDRLPDLPRTPVYQRLQLVLNYYKPVVEKIFERYRGQVASPQILEQMNADLRHNESVDVYCGKPSLADVVSDAFGLPSPYTFTKMKREDLTKKAKIHNL